MFKCWFFLCRDIHVLTQIAILITNGRSDDPVDAAAGLVADNGISLFAVGKCRTDYCEFHWCPHCSWPSDFYLSTAGLSAVFFKFVSCLFEYIVLGKCVGEPAQMQAEQHLPSMYVRISEWLIFLLCWLYRIELKNRNTFIYPRLGKFTEKLHFWHCEE